MNDGVIVRRQSLASQVADAVLEMIHTQALRPGDGLPSTGDLAERFMVSRTVVREALADLAGRGLIERSQGRESVVSMPGPEQLQDLLRFQIRRENIGAGSLIEIRQSIEVLSARLAAERHEAEDAAALKAGIERMVNAKGDQEFHEADIAFHRLVAVASKNPLIVLVLDAFVELMREQQPRYFRGHQRRGRSLKVVTDEHRKICDAVIARKAADAVKAMSEHLAASQRDLEAADA
jgi:GntR family transcriptional repressor for pyruvate dehydrogenase complex